MMIFRQRRWHLVCVMYFSGGNGTGLPGGSGTGLHGGSGTWLPDDDGGTWLPEDEDGTWLPKDDAGMSADLRVYVRTLAWHVR